MLHDWQFGKDVRLVHSNHPGIYLGPASHSANVIEHGGVPVQAGRLDRVDEADAAEVHVLVTRLHQHIIVVDGFGIDVRVI